MKILKLTVCVALLLPLFSGCSASTTTAQKSHDDQARDLMIELGTLKGDDQKEKGQAIFTRLVALRSQVSDKVRQDIDLLISPVAFRESSETESAQRPRTTAVDPETTRAEAPKRVKQDPNIRPEIELTEPGLDSNLPSAIAEEPVKVPELAPAPRVVK